MPYSQSNSPRVSPMDAPLSAAELEQISAELFFSKRAGRLVAEIRRCWAKNAQLQTQIAEIERAKAMEQRSASHPS